MLKGFLSVFWCDGIDRASAKFAIAYSKLLGFLRALSPSGAIIAYASAAKANSKAITVVITIFHGFKDLLLWPRPIRVVSITVGAKRRWAVLNDAVVIGIRQFGAVGALCRMPSKIAAVVLPVKACRKSS